MSLNGIPIEDFPALAPPAGQVSNFTDPKTLGPAIIGINVVLITLMIIVVLVRMYARTFLTKSLGWDDFTCVISALGSITHTVLLLYDTHLGYGKHLWDIRAITLTAQVIRDFTALAIIYPLVIFFVKLSITLLYLRLFSIDRNFRRLAISGIVFIWVFYTGLFGYEIAVTVLCGPTTGVSPLVCTSNDKISIAAGTFNVVSDLWLLLLPIPLILRLNLRKTQRLGLVAVFSIGFSACLVSFARLVYLGVLLDNASEDLLYNAALTTVLTGVELNIGIIATCMTTMPLAFTRSKLVLGSKFHSLRTHLFSSRNGSKVSSKTSKQPSTDEYIELNDNNKSNEIRVFGRKPSGEADAESNPGILRTVEYNVDSGHGA